MPRKLLRIAVLIETSRGYGRGLLQGIMRYEQEHGPWSIYFEPRGLFDPPPPWLSRWDGDGILARVGTAEMARAVDAAGVPAIDLRFSEFSQHMPAVGSNNDQVVEIAFEHLWEQGFRAVGFCGLAEGMNFWSEYRGDRLEKLARQAGAAFFRFQPPRSRRTSTPWEKDQQKLAAWLEALPRPIGILAFNDERALQLLDAARRVRLRVPDEIGVLGIDNDELLCNLARPALSSVNLGLERVGYTAAAQLERLIRGKPLKQHKTRLAPLGVVARESTNILAHHDKQLTELLRRVRESACDGLSVSKLLSTSELSASTLQRRFKALLGRSPKEEITRVRLEKARQLLVATNLAIGDVALRSGFSEPKHLSTIFRQKLGLSPQAYREQCRAAHRGEG